MKKSLRIAKSILSLCIITLISFLICFSAALLILYIFGPSDTTYRAGASILIFGSIFVAMILGAFND